MKSSVRLATCAAIVSGFTAGLLAQQPPPSNPPAQASSSKAITISGCVQRAEQGPTGTSGTAGATRDSSESKFLLTSAAASTSATAGTSGSNADAAIAPSYRLDADDAKLTPHVGHKVEIAGTVDQPSSASTSSTSAPKLKVETIKMIAASCP
jgi:hypothetical protein